MINLEKFINKYVVELCGWGKFVREMGTEGDIYCSDNSYLNDTFILAESKLHTLESQIFASLKSKCISLEYIGDIELIDWGISFTTLEDSECNIVLNTFNTSKVLYDCFYEFFIKINGIELDNNELKQLLPNTSHY